MGGEIKLRLCGLNSGSTRFVMSIGAVGVIGAVGAVGAIIILGSLEPTSFIFYLSQG